MNVASVQRGSKERTGTAARSAPASHCVPGYWKRTHSAAYRASRSRIAMMWTMACHLRPLDISSAPPSVAGPSGGHRGGCRLEPIEVPQGGVDDADEGRSDAAIGPE